MYTEVYVTEVCTKERDRNVEVQEVQLVKEGGRYDRLVGVVVD